MKEKRSETNPSVLRTWDLGIFKVKSFLSYFFGENLYHYTFLGNCPATPPQSQH